MDLACREHAGEPVGLEFRLDGERIHATAFSGKDLSLGSLRLPAGDHTLAITRGAAPGGTIGGLMRIGFSLRNCPP